MMLSPLKPLPLYVSPVRGESATSLASRIARKNGTASLQSFCADMSISYRALKVGDPIEIERVAALAGCDPTTLRNWTPHAPSKTNYQLGAEAPRFTAYSRSLIRGCPKCAAESRSKHGAHGPFHLGIWQLTSIRTCAQHSCMLIEVPPPTHHKHSYDFARMVDNMNLSDVKPVAEEARSLERYLIGRLEGASSGCWLDTLDFHVAAQLCENFGLLLTNGPKASRTETTERQWLEAGAAGYDILRNGPDHMFATLEELRMKAGPGCHTYGAIAGSFLTWLSQREDDAAFNDIRQIVFDYILRTYPVLVGSTVLRLRCDRQQVYSLRKGAKAYGIDERMLRHKLLERGDISKSGKSGAITYRRYPSRETLQQLAEETNGLLRGFDAADYLGLDIHLLRTFVVEGLIKKAGEMARNAPYFRKKDLDAFLGRLYRQTRPKLEPANDEIPLIAATPACQCSTLELLHLVFEHDIPLRCAAGTDPRFNDFLISVERAKTAIGQSSVGAISMSEAAGKLGVDTATIRNLVNAGYLSAAPKTAKSSERWLVVDEASVTTFGERYISAADLARELRRDTANLCRELYKNGVEPLVFNGENRIIFRRRDVNER
ncbi:TniQ protein [Celeribacter baekdonensis]|uniref:TniQ protein n=1 Tax=Celeribacter baekdonensis TaxID=875171 RepID=A0A1G7U8J5_9RHOB|nr:TniQ family protein [Celeribacter baekdonensis]SDG43070.1 TniQ protein [Celeribacter baekdonensis]